MEVVSMEAGERRLAGLDFFPVDCASLLARRFLLPRAMAVMIGSLTVLVPCRHLAEQNPSQSTVCQR
jgi:hypothetical protein